MISVIGGGLGGLMLARVLVSHGIEVAVFEGDASRAARHQGGMLDLHVESGQAALRAGGLFEAFQARALAEGDATRVMDRDGNVLFDQRGNGERPEIERGALRDLLIDSLPEGVIRWGHRLHEIRQDGTPSRSRSRMDARTVRLPSSAPTAPGRRCDRSSRARRRRTRGSRSSSRGSRARRSSTRASRRSPGMGRSSRSLLARPSSRTASPTTRSACTRRSRGRSRSSSGSTRRARSPRSVAGARIYVGSSRRTTGLWSPARSTCYPSGIGGLTSRGVTLLGDAAHLMSPFAGEGANLALFDGAELARAIVERPGNVETAFATYETAMFERSARAAADSVQGLELCLGEDAPHALLRFFRSHGEREDVALGVVA